MVLQMFGVGTVFLVIAIVAALFGFGVVSDDDPLVAKLGAGFFLLAALAAFGWGWMNRSRNVGPASRGLPIRSEDQRVTAAKPMREARGSERTMAWSSHLSTEIRVQKPQDVTDTARSRR